MTRQEQPGSVALRADLDRLDLIWGVARIADAIGRTVRQTETALAKKELPGRKVNGRWVASRKKLVEHFEGAGA